VPFISHTGARGAHNGPKNMSDELLRAVADRGGIIGLYFVMTPLATSTATATMPRLENRFK
jgi:membrane dipeptidase